MDLLTNQDMEKGPYGENGRAQKRANIKKIKKNHSPPPLIFSIPFPPPPPQKKRIDKNKKKLELSSAKLSKQVGWILMKLDEFFDTF